MARMKQLAVDIAEASPDQDEYAPVDTELQDSIVTESNDD